MWEHRTLQTFFTNNKTRYFVIVKAEDEIVQAKPANDIGHMIQTLLDQQEMKEQEEERKESKLIEEQLNFDNTPWLRRVGWPRRFTGKDLAAIACAGGYSM